MATLEQLAQIGQDARLLTIFKVGVKRAVYMIVTSQNATADQIAWAKRARLTFNDVRVDFYATLILEGALVENAAFRDACEAALGGQQGVNFSDVNYMSIVNTWVTRFVAQNI